MKKQVKHAVVLAGGRSSRMGTDKALVTLGGMTMLERVVRAALGGGLAVVVVGRSAPAGWPADLRVGFLADEAPAFSGPATGLVRGIEHVGGSVLALGCDMPLLTPGAIGALLGAHEQAPAGTAATLARRDFAEPAFSVYTPHMLRRLREIVAQERRGFQWLLGEPDVFVWEIPADFAGELLNVNDAATLREATRILGARGLQRGRGV